MWPQDNINTAVLKDSQSPIRKGDEHGNKSKYHSKAYKTCM